MELVKKIVVGKTKVEKKPATLFTETALITGSWGQKIKVTAEGYTREEANTKLQGTVAFLSPKRIT